MSYRPSCFLSQNVRLLRCSWAKVQACSIGRSGCRTDIISRLVFRWSERSICQEFFSKNMHIIHMRIVQCMQTRAFNSQGGLQCCRSNFFFLVHGSLSPHRKTWVLRSSTSLKLTLPPFPLARQFRNLIWQQLGCSIQELLTLLPDSLQLVDLTPDLRTITVLANLGIAILGWCLSSQNCGCGTSCSERNHNGKQRWASKATYHCASHARCSSSSSDRKRSHYLSDSLVQPLPFWSLRLSAAAGRLPCATFAQKQPGPSAGGLESSHVGAASAKDAHWAELLHCHSPSSWHLQQTLHRYHALLQALSPHPGSDPHASSTPSGTPWRSLHASISFLQPPPGQWPIQ